jgi:hypothetical protein
MLVRAVRFLTVAVALSVALSWAVEAQAERPKPEPASGTSSRPLMPDPVPSAQTAPPSPASSASSHYSGPSSASSGSSAPASVPPSTQDTPPPATGARHAPVAKPPAAQQTAKAKRHRAAAARRASRQASAFLSSLTAFIAKETKLPTGVAVPRSTSSTSTLLLVGAFALVVLALGDAMFLTFIGRQVGIRPRRRQREPRPAAYWDADGPIRRVPLER